MYGMKFIETSAKSAKNVDEAFIRMAKEIMAQNNEKEKALKKNGMT